MTLPAALSRAKPSTRTPRSVVVPPTSATTAAAVRPDRSAAPRREFAPNPLIDG
jgi:hypothetical protein